MTCTAELFYESLHLLPSHDRTEICTADPNYRWLWVHGTCVGSVGPRANDGNAYPARGRGPGSGRGNNHNDNSWLGIVGKRAVM